MIEFTVWLSAGGNASRSGISRAAVSAPIHLFSAALLDGSTAGSKESRCPGAPIQTSQGNQAAFFWRNEDSDAAPKNIWLLFGGNGDIALTWMDLIQTFPNPDTGYLLIDYPGYGISEGRPNPCSILESSEHALQTLLKKKSWAAGAARPCVLGHSLGGAAALQFAARN